MSKAVAIGFGPGPIQEALDKCFTGVFDQQRITIVHSVTPQLLTSTFSHKAESTYEDFSSVTEGTTAHPTYISLQKLNTSIDTLTKNNVLSLTSVKLVFTGTGCIRTTGSWITIGATPTTRAINYNGILASLDDILQKVERANNTITKGKRTRDVAVTSEDDDFKDTTEPCKRKRITISGLYNRQVDYSVQAKQIYMILQQNQHVKNIEDQFLRPILACAMFLEEERTPGGIIVELKVVNKTKEYHLTLYGYDEVDRLALNCLKQVCIDSVSAAIKNKTAEVDVIIDLKDKTIRLEIRLTSLTKS